MSKSSDSLDLTLSPHDQAVKLMASWIGAIADQVKNPVAGISAAASLIEREMSSFRAAKEWDPALVEEAVRLMIQRLSTFDHYLTELSGFTRPVKIHPKWFDINFEWNSIEQYLARRIPREFNIQLNVEGSWEIYADKERFYSIMAAVVLNAVESCGSTINPKISVQIYSEQPDDFKVLGRHIEIIDNGIGFSEDALIQGFVPFFTTKEAGTGLGLAMVEKYVRAHGGWVKISNQTAQDHSVLTGGVVDVFFPCPNE
jgi:nitrogen fixation/metabolism regulation signal transduction histidine kinase